jgi:hypothetical protein
VTAPKASQSLLIVGGARHGEILELPAQRLPATVTINDAGHRVELRVTSWASHSLLSRALDGGALRVLLAMNPDAEPSVQGNTATVVLDAVLRAARAGRVIPIVPVPPGSAR